MISNHRIRLFAAAAIAVVIPLGLVARRIRPDEGIASVGDFVATYAADTLWPVLFYCIGRFIWPIAGRQRVGAGVLLFTWALEFSQLVKFDWLIWLRHQPGIGFLLGDTFVWSDVVCCFVGTLAAVAGDWLLRSAAAEPEIRN